MKRDGFLVSMLIVILGVVLVGCVGLPVSSSPISPRGDDKNENFIIIKSVSPNTDLIDGQEQKFIVSVDYILTTHEQGEIDICFNNGDNIDWDKFDSEHEITKGGGSHIFTTSTMAKNWGSQGDFSVSAYLSPYPKVEGSEALAYDKYVLTFK
jgi:hypothetical protein